MRRFRGPVVLAGALAGLAGLGVLVVLAAGGRSPDDPTDDDNGGGAGVRPVADSDGPPAEYPAAGPDDGEEQVAPSPLASLSDEDLELPPVDRVEAVATLHYLQGPGRDLAVLAAVGDRVARNNRLDPQRCRDIGVDLVDAAAPDEMIVLTAGVDDEVVRGGLQAQIRALTVLFDVCVHGDTGGGPGLGDQHDRVVEINDLIGRRLTDLEQAATP